MSINLAAQIQMKLWNDLTLSIRPSAAPHFFEIWYVVYPPQGSSALNRSMVDDPFLSFMYDSRI